MTHPLAPLLAYRQWVIVKLVPLADGKIDKLPIDPRTGHVTERGQGGAHNAAVWLDYASAYNAAQRAGSSYTIGFVLTAADPFFCVDFDSALLPDRSGWAPGVLELLGQLPNTVVEVSVSGTGLHAWGQGAVPPHYVGNKPLGDGASAALYSENRFMVIGTGQVGDMTNPCPTIAAIAAQRFATSTERNEVPDDGPCAEWRGPTDDDELVKRHPELTP